MSRLFKYLVGTLLAVSFLDGIVRAGDTVVATLAGTRAMELGNVPQATLPHSTSKWSGHSFLLYDHGKPTPILYAFDRSGRLVANAPIMIDGARSTTVSDFASGPDGSIWVCGFSASTSGQLGNFLANISDGGQAVLIVATTPYQPMKIAVAPDGSVWTVGFEYPPSKPSGELGKIDRTLKVLRHFDQFGKFLSSAVPLSTVRDISITTNGRLAVSSDRIAWYAPDNGPGDDRTRYFEYFPADQALKSYSAVPGDPRRTLIMTLALTPSNAVYAYADESLSGGLGNKSSVFTLDRESGQWFPLTLPKGPALDLKGNDGELLVFAGQSDSSVLQLVDFR